MGFAVGALAALGEAERAKEWAERALLLDPDNLNLRYNFACAYVELREIEEALDLLDPLFKKTTIELVDHAKVDPDLDPIRDHPRFKAMLAAAEARLAGTFLMQRKLTAILSADVVGYSGLMEADETGTLERLKANRSHDLRSPCRHSWRARVQADGRWRAGRVLQRRRRRQLRAGDTGGDGEGGSRRSQAASATASASISVRSSSRATTSTAMASTLPPGSRRWRPVGGVALSAIRSRSRSKGKLPCEFEDMGEHTVKNIETPVHVFSVRAAGPEGHKVEEPRKLSICVLPFANMSGDPEQEYFSDGISEDIITDLSKVSALWVVARNTAFTFKGKHVDVPQVARQLKVSHVLEGSVRKSGGRVRITAQLIDGATDGHIWAERYDRDLNDIFALQDEISEAIVKALKLKLLPEEKKAIEQRGTNNLEAYKLYLMARQYSVTGNLGAARRGEAIIRLCRRAIELDPNYALAWALIAVTEREPALYVGGRATMVWKPPNGRFRSMKILPKRMPRRRTF